MVNKNTTCTYIHDIHYCYDVDLEVFSNSSCKLTYGKR